MQSFRKLARAKNHLSDLQITINCSWKLRRFSLSSTNLQTCLILLLQKAL